MSSVYPAYSPLFHTLYDEQSPIGQLGRGAHYSVLAVPQWRSPDGENMVLPLVQRIGIIWDEDHDTRVIQVLEAGYMNGLLAPVLFIGERKASLTIVVASEDQIAPEHEHLWSKVHERVLDDYWDVRIIPLSAVAREQMIHDSRRDAVETYFTNIQNLWELGLHTHRSQRHEGSSNMKEELVNFSRRIGGSKGR